MTDRTRPSWAGARWRDGRTKNQFQLPEGLENWSQRQFVIIDHESQPDNESVAIDRVARVVRSLLDPGAGRSDD